MQDLAIICGLSDAEECCELEDALVCSSAQNEPPLNGPPLHGPPLAPPSTDNDRSISPNNLQTSLFSSFFSSHSGNSGTGQTSRSRYHFSNNGFSNTGSKDAQSGSNSDFSNLGSNDDLFGSNTGVSNSGSNTGESGSNSGFSNTGVSHQSGNAVFSNSYRSGQSRVSENFRTFPIQTISKNFQNSGGTRKNTFSATFSASRRPYPIRSELISTFSKSFDQPSVACNSC